MDVLIGGILPLSTIDFENRSASVIFFCGCNFRCPWCYNYKILDPINCAKKDTKEVFDYVMEGKELISGIVFTGGEPTIQPEPLKELCKLFKQQGLAVKIDTNGANAGIIAELLARNLVDHVALDIKAPLVREREYSKVIGVNAKKPINEICEIMRLKKAFNFRFECRTTIVPGVIYRERDIEEIAKEISGRADFYVLQQFTPEKGTLDPTYSKLKPPTRDELFKLGLAAKKYVKDIRIRTSEFGEEKL